MERPLESRAVREASSVSGDRDWYCVLTRVARYAKIFTASSSSATSSNALASVFAWMAAVWISDIRVDKSPKACSMALNNGSTYGYSSSVRSEEHTSELQSLMRISYAVFCLKKKIITATLTN